MCSRSGCEPSSEKNASSGRRHGHHLASASWRERRENVSPRERVELARRRRRSGRPPERRRREPVRASGQLLRWTLPSSAGARSSSGRTPGTVTAADLLQPPGRSRRPSSPRGVAQVSPSRPSPRGRASCAAQRAMPALRRGDADRRAVPADGELGGVGLGRPHLPRPLPAHRCLAQQGDVRSPSATNAARSSDASRVSPRPP
jgi:hypothetical protein